LPESDDDAIGIAALALLIATVLSALIAIVVVVFNAKLVVLFNNKEIGFWLYFTPVTIWLTGLFYILTYLNNRKKLYRDLAKMQVYKSVAMISLQLGIGFVKSGSFGLIVGQIASYFVSTYRLFKNANSSYNIGSWQKQSLMSHLVRYKKFPLYSLPGALLNAVSGNMISLYLPTLFSLSTLGFYSLAQRALGAPAALIGTSVSQVFFQHATEEKNETGKIINTFNATLKKLVLISLPIFGFIFFTVEDIFAFVFGETWREAGFYAKILTPMFAINFIVSALTLTDTIMEKQQYYMYFNIFLFLSTLLVIFFFRSSGIELFLTALSISVSIVYVLYAIVSRQVAKAEL
jgi:O-antigen/teichoic acid export membrane protein